MIGHYLRKKHARQVHQAMRFMLYPQRFVIGANPNIDINWDDHKWGAPFVTGKLGPWITHL